MISNLTHAARNHETVTIGGGEFSRPDFLLAAHMLDCFQPMLEVLTEIVGQEKPCRWGYDAAGVALDDNWRARARAVLAMANKYPKA